MCAHLRHIALSSEIMVMKISLPLTSLFTALHSTGTHLRRHNNTLPRHHLSGLTPLITPTLSSWIYHTFRLVDALYTPPSPCITLPPLHIMVIAAIKQNWTPRPFPLHSQLKYQSIQFDFSPFQPTPDPSSPIHSKKPPSIYSAAFFQLFPLKSYYF